MERPPDKVWTYDDLLAVQDDGKRYEIIDGELFEMSSPVVTHQRVLGNLYVAFREQVQRAGHEEVFIAPLDVIMSPTRVVQPDLIVVRPNNREILRDHIYGVPDLLVEILSPSNRKHDSVLKRRLYARNRVPEYWMVDPDQHTVEVLELLDGGLSFRQHGWYASGDRARSAKLDIEISIDELFSP